MQCDVCAILHYAPVNQCPPGSPPFTSSSPPSFCSAALRTVLRTAEGHKPTRDQEAVAKICAFLSEQQQAPSHL